MAYTTPANTTAAADHMFPTLTAAQQARVAAHGSVRQVSAGETLLDPDDNDVKFFVVVTGHLNILTVQAHRLRPLLLYCLRF